MNKNEIRVFTLSNHFQAIQQLLQSLSNIAEIQTSNPSIHTSLMLRNVYNKWKWGKRSLLKCELT